jgi:hypothetical protein
MEYAVYLSGLVNAGSCMDSTNTTILKLLSSTIFDFSFAGPQGRDQAAPFGADTWVALYAIKAPGPTDTVIGSLSFVAPTIPLGFGPEYRRIGTARMDAGAVLARFSQYGRSVDRKYLFAEQQPTYTVTISVAGFYSLAFSFPPIPVTAGAAVNEQIGIWGARALTFAAAAAGTVVELSGLLSPTIGSPIQLWATSVIGDSVSAQLQMTARANPPFFPAPLFVSLPAGVALTLTMNGWQESLQQ